MAAVLVCAWVTIGCDRQGSVRLSEDSPTDQKPELVQPAAPFDEERLLVVALANGEELDAKLHVPPEADRNGWGVLLIAGGMGNDLDWTVPGSITVGDQTTQLTISGEPHADGPVLSSALLAKGFTVLRWSTLARGDPLADQWPVLATPRSQADLLQQTKASLAILRNAGSIDQDKIILIAHSLGAARACTIAAEDQGVRAVVLLAPAYFTSRDSPPRAFAEGELRFGEEVVRDRSLRSIAFVGELDDFPSVDAPGLQGLAQSGRLPHFELVMLPEVGHQLSAYMNGKHGPIDGDSVELIASWAEQAAERFEKKVW